MIVARTERREVHLVVVVVAAILVAAVSVSSPRSPKWTWTKTSCRKPPVGVSPQPLPPPPPVHAEWRRAVRRTDRYCLIIGGRTYRCRRHCLRRLRCRRCRHRRASVVPSWETRTRTVRALPPQPVSTHPCGAHRNDVPAAAIALVAASVAAPVAEAWMRSTTTTTPPPPPPLPDPPTCSRWHRIVEQDQLPWQLVVVPRLPLSLPPVGHHHRRRRRRPALVHPAFPVRETSSLGCWRQAAAVPRRRRHRVLRR